MNFVGDKSAWTGFVTEDMFLQTVLAIVLQAWKAAKRPDCGDLEDKVTRCLYASIMRSPLFKESPVRVDYDRKEIDLETHAITGIPDLKFSTNGPQLADEFISFECKRLRRLSRNGECTTHNATYVDGEGQGMVAFIEGRYRAPRGHAAMIGYIACEAGTDPCLSLASFLRKKSKRLGLVGRALQESKHAPKEQRIRYTQHRTVDGCELHLLHVFLRYSECAGS